MSEALQEHNHSSLHGSYRSYLIGFVFSLLLTLGAYYAVVHRDLLGEILSVWGLTLLLAGFAVLQAVFQLICFLNLGHEHRPRWNLMAFGFMVLVISILVGGSLWIMQNLSERTMQMPHMENHVSP